MMSTYLAAKFKKKTKLAGIGSTSIAPGVQRESLGGTPVPCGQVEWDKVRLADRKALR